MRLVLPPVFSSHLLLTLAQSETVVVAGLVAGAARPTTAPASVRYAAPVAMESGPDADPAVVFPGRSRHPPGSHG